jgi:uncharacterized protein YbjT (DUF2867 family)
LRVTIAGASGFVGKNLIEKISSSHSIKAISRESKSSNIENLKWIAADLYSLNSTIEALSDTDVAIYLVHSMMPSARLFQGNFEDTDILLADNFARACKKNNVKQIIYLGGLVPEKNISKHLESRREVEDVLKHSDIPVTVLRAGMVVGDCGSSFEILKNLVLNLPAMVLPKWTQSTTQVIYIDDLISSITKSIGDQDFFNKTLDVVNGESLTYEKLIRKTAEHFHKKKLLIPVPVNYTSFSKLWVKIFGEADYELVAPLIDSLVCDLPTSIPDPLLEDCIKYTKYEDMLQMIHREKINRKFAKRIKQDKSVRSIQRLPNPKKLTNDEISKKYVSWLPKKFRFLINISEKNDIINFNLSNLKTPLLQLQRVNETEEIDRVKFHIIGGLLSETKNTGWLEFRQVSDRRYTLSSIHEFYPSLPWYIYKLSQAPVHAWVMYSFGKFLSQKTT